MAQVHGRAHSLDKQVKYTGKRGTVLRAAADFFNAAYVGRGQLAKRSSIRKGLPGMGLGPCVHSCRGQSLLVGVEVAAVGVMQFLGGVRCTCSNLEENNQGNVRRGLTYLDCFLSVYPGASSTGAVRAHFSLKLCLS